MIEQFGFHKLISQLSTSDVYFAFGSHMTTIHSIYDGTNAQQNEALLHTDCGFSDTQLTSDECVEDFLTGRIVGHADVASDEGIRYTMAGCWQIAFSQAVCMVVERPSRILRCPATQRATCWRQMMSTQATSLFQ